MLYCITGRAGSMTDAPAIATACRPVLPPGGFSFSLVNIHSFCYSKNSVVDVVVHCPSFSQSWQPDLRCHPSVRSQTEGIFIFVPRFSFIRHAAHYILYIQPKGGRTMNLSNDERELLSLVRQKPEIISHVLTLILDARSKRVQNQKEA